jgi:hypothetical protein
MQARLGQPLDEEPSPLSARVLHTFSMSPGHDPDVSIEIYGETAVFSAPGYLGAIMILRLISLYCSTTEDDAGADEPYLLVNGIEVWGDESPGLNNGQTADLSAVPQITFDVRARVELFDRDLGGAIDPDDLLGRFYAGKSQLDQGEVEYKFVLDDADYTLTYEVTK